MTKIYDSFLKQLRALHEDVQFSAQVYNKSLQKIKIDEIKIDKISITFDIENLDKTSFGKHINEIKKSDTISSFNYELVYGSRYKYSFLLLISEEDSVLIQLDPRSKKIAYFRMEWNPSKLVEKGSNIITEILESIFSDYIPKGYSNAFEYVYEKAKVTNIELCIDIWGLHISRVFCSGPEQRKRRVYFSKNGMLESVYIGIGNEQLIIYDKAKHIKDKKKVSLALKNKMKGKICTRIEIKTAKAPPLKELSTMNNIFKGMEVHDIGFLKWHNFNTTSPTFLDELILRVQIVGLNTVLDNTNFLDTKESFAIRNALLVNKILTHDQINDLWISFQNDVQKLFTISSPVA